MFSPEAAEEQEPEVCAVCLNSLSRPVPTLPTCGHSFCMLCINDWSEVSHSSVNLMSFNEPKAVNTQSCTPLLLALPNHTATEQWLHIRGKKFDIDFVVFRPLEI